MALTLFILAAGALIAWTLAPASIEPRPKREPAPAQVAHTVGSGGSNRVRRDKATVSPPPRGRAPVKAPVRAARTIVGVVRLDGAPVEGAAVWLSDSHLSRLGAADVAAVTTDVSGAFSLVAGGTDETCVLARHPDAPVVSIVLPSDPPEEPSSVLIDLVRGVDLRGTVVDSRGDPIAGVQIVATGGAAEPGMATGTLFPGGAAQQASSGVAVTDASGQFVVPGLRAGLEHHLRVRKFGCMLEAGTAQPGIHVALLVPTADIMIHMTRTLAARVLLRVGDTEQRLPDCRIEILATGAYAALRGQFDGPEGESDSRRPEQLADGFVVLRGRAVPGRAEPPSVRLHVSALGFEPATLNATLVPSSAPDATDVPPVVARLRPVQAAFGSVDLILDVPDDVPSRATGFPCKLEWEGQSVELWHLGAADRLVELHMVPAGAVAISRPHSMMAPMFDWTPLNVDVTAGHTVSVHVPLRIAAGRGIVNLTVHDERGHFIGGFIFRATHGGTTSSGRQTDRVGPSAVFAVDAGSLEIVVEHSGFARKTITVDVSGGHVLPVDVTLLREGR